MAEHEENPPLEAALAYASWGWRVLPLYPVIDGKCTCNKPDCNPGKHPIGQLVRHGAADATTDEATIRRWWGQVPNANVGVATGPESGVWMLGPDGQVGVNNLDDLERRHGPLPTTPRAKSGGGGRHYIFAWPAEGDIQNKTDINGLAIDTRGKGGLFVAAPSVNGEGPYTWEVPPETAPTAPAPEWLLEWVRGGKSVNKLKEERANGKASSFVYTPQSEVENVRARAVAYLASCPPAVSEQGGHSQTLSAARAVVYGFDLGPEVGFELLWQHYNPRCLPPWSERELRHKCQEAHEKPFDKPRGHLLNREGDKSTPGPASGPTVSARPGGGLVLEVRTLDGVQPEPVEFLVENFIPLAKVTLFAGRGGLGKSHATLDLTAAVSTGRCAFGLTYSPPPPADVLLCFAEDDAADTVVPRLLAAGADLRRVHEVTGLKGPDGKRLPFSLAACGILAEELKRRPEVKLVVIDPIGVFAGRTGIDTHKEASVQAMLSELRDVAVAHRVAIVLVGHVNKSEEAKARNRVSGSAAFVNSARACFLFTEDAEDPDRRLILPIKFNCGPEPEGLVYGCRPLNAEELARVLAALDHLDEEQRQLLLGQLFRLDWKGQTAETADEVLTRKQPVVRDADRAAEWLRVFLKDRPRPSNECVSTGNRTLKLTRPDKWWSGAILRDVLGGQSRRVGFGPGSRCYYTLPAHQWPFPGLEEEEKGGQQEEGPTIIPLPGVTKAGAEPTTTPAIPDIAAASGVGGGYVEACDETAVLPHRSTADQQSADMSDMSGMTDMAGMETPVEQGQDQSPVLTIPTITAIPDIPAIPPAPVCGDSKGVCDRMTAAPHRSTGNQELAAMAGMESVAGMADTETPTLPITEGGPILTTPTNLADAPIEHQPETMPAPTAAPSVEGNDLIF